MKVEGDNSLEQEVISLRKMADILVPYTFPLVPVEEEQKILILKQRIIFVDGYEVSVIFSKSQYPKDNVVETLQISSLDFPFLPFRIVCKLAQAFLGNEHVAYAEFIKFGRKIYCWNVRYQEGNKIPSHSESHLINYEDFQYTILPIGCGNLYG